MEIACNLKTDTDSVRGTVRVSKLNWFGLMIFKRYLNG